MINIVLDTNCLISSISKRGNYFNVWRGLHSGKYILYVSNEILEEYEETSMKINALIASNVIQALLNSPYVSLSFFIRNCSMGTLKKLDSDIELGSMKQVSASLLVEDDTLDALNWTSEFVGRWGDDRVTEEIAEDIRGARTLNREFEL